MPGEMPIDYSEIAVSLLALIRRARDAGASEREAVLVAGAWVVGMLASAKEDDGS